jgi:cyclopropane fatty-acyl-phospholipid synthase-like methyltransferase
MKQFAESCEQNKHPILEVLKKEFADVHAVLEIGSGTGQHAVFFAAQLPHLVWQPSDVVSSHTSITAWIADAELDNVLPPLELDVAHNHWPAQQYDAIFSANTTHIMSWPEVEKLFAGIGKVLKSGGRFCLYGPFNYGGQYTSDSNAQFDQWLKARNPKSGIRDIEALDELAAAHGMKRINDYAMPANNRTLVWQKD